MSVDAQTPARHLPLQGVFNFRDLGGYAGAGGRTVRWRHLFRADALTRLTDDDVESLRGIGLRTVLDLRSPAELDERGRFPSDVLPVTFRHLPILESLWDPALFADDLPAAAFLTARYLDMLAEGRRAIADAVEVLADPDAYPAVFHCAAGKDRTGVLAAIVLSLVGVTDDDIARDYGLSRDSMTALRDWWRANEPGGDDSMTRQPAAFLEAPVDAMHGFLEAVRDTHGSVAGWVADAGVGPEVVAAVRRNLLEQP